MKGGSISRVLQVTEVSCLPAGLGAIVPRLGTALVTPRASFPWGGSTFLLSFAQCQGPSSAARMDVGIPCCWGRDGWAGPLKDMVLDRRGVARDLTSVTHYLQSPSGFSWGAISPGTEACMMRSGGWSTKVGVQKAEQSSACLPERLEGNLAFHLAYGHCFLSERCWAASPARPFPNAQHFLAWHFSVCLLSWESIPPQPVAANSVGDAVERGEQEPIP